MKQSLLLFLGFAALISCSNKETDDKEAPVITLTSPSNNQVFTPGEIRIKGTITDNAYIGQVHIEVYDKDSGDEIVHVHIHPTSKTYAVDYPVVLQSGTNYKIKIVADDPAANTSSKQVEISCN